jgi:class 3 adenylate cyclase/tetratricopeptide (TPR) repeat protein
MAVCAQCGAENRAEARFCDSCGAALAVEAESAREERKVVSVLFADLVGFTSRAERMDPEDVRALLSPYYGHVRGELERYGGTVEKFIGDAVMALFGAPVVHEDDPERAVRAALTIRDWIREQEGDLHLRVAVTTGEALVALGARPSEGEGMASGDVVNTAARLQSAAPVDGILVDETTYRATSHVIDYRAAEAVEAKGKSEPVPAWEAVEARSRYGVDTIQAPRAPLIGRERELDVLADALARVRADRAPQLVTLVGVPGIGKSRLVYELFQVVEADPEIIYWRQGRSLPYGEGVSFWALGEMVKAHAGILETDVPEDAAHNLRRSVGDLVEEADADWVTRHLEPLVGVVADQDLHGDRRSEAFAAWRRFFEAVAEERPLVLVFEDLHWADEGLLDFVDHLVEWAGGSSILVVCTARPELLSRRAGWGGGKPNAATLSLSPLDDDQTARLLAALLERSVLPAETQTALLQRAGGNPLYAEEFVRMVGDRGLAGLEGELPLPESVQGIVAARLDGLPDREKTLLQDAAVIGKVFWLGAARGLGGLDESAASDALHQLERKEFVRRERRSSVAGETEYAFRHLLVRDVAYGQIPRAHRAEKHRLAAEWIEASGRLEDTAELVAHHYLTALELATAAGSQTASLAERARLALREAGDRAYALSAYPAARRFYAAAVELWPSDDPDRPDLLLRYGRSISWIEATAGVDVLTEARDAFVAAGDAEPAAEVEMLLAEAIWLTGQRDRAFEQIAAAEALLAGASSSPSQAFVLSNVSRFAMLAGDKDKAIRVGREALAMAEELELEVTRSHALNNIGTARIAKGDEGGLEDLEESIAIALAVNSPEAIRGHGNLGSVLMDMGHVERSFAHIEEGRRLAERFGVVDHLRWLSAEMLWEPYFDGRWDEALRGVDETIADFVETQFWMETPCRWLRGRMRLARGDTNGAQEDASRAIELARLAKDPQVLWPALAFGARACCATDRRRANALVDEILSDWKGQQLMISGSDSEWISDLIDVLPRLRREQEFFEVGRAQMTTRWRQAARALFEGDFSAAAETYSSMGVLPAEAFVRLRFAEALVGQGWRTEADAELQRSLAFWRSVGATAYVREGEALLAASA